MSNAVRVTQARRDWGSDDTGLNVMHVDMDAFYASVEIAQRPELRGQPVIVAGGERSVVLAASYEARELGVRSAMPTQRARLLAPHAVWVAPRHHEYARISRSVMDYLDTITPWVEQVSIDEAYLDVSGIRGPQGTLSARAQELRAQVKAHHGVTCSVGVAANKFLAKLCSTQAKPDGLLVLPRGQEQEFLNLLPIGALMGIGDKSERRLKQHGLHTIRDVAVLEPSYVVALLGATLGNRLIHLARGIDDRPVTPTRVEKSVGAEHTFAQDEGSREVLRATVRSLADTVTSRLRSRGLLARTISVKIRDVNFHTITRHVTLHSPSQSLHVVFSQAWTLVDRQLLPGQRARLLGVRAEQLVPEEGQPLTLTLEESLTDHHDTTRKTEETIDAIRAKFGSRAISLGVQSGLQLPKS